MKRLMTFGLAAAAIAGASAMTATKSVAKMNSAETVETLRSHDKAIKRLPSDVVRNFGINRAKAFKSEPLTLNPKFNSKVHVKTAGQDGYVLYENFSGWDFQNQFWVPDGWTVEHLGECSLEESWMPFAYAPGYPMPVDGDCYYGIYYSSDPQDEWFISPAVEISKNMELSYWLYIEPLYFYDLDNVDWDTNEFTEKVVLNDFQVLAREEGGEWQVVVDYVDKYKDYSFIELMYSSTYSLEKQTVSLDSFSGKKVQLAFRLFGRDGNLILLDAIGVGLPSVEGITYQNPLNTLYFGFNNNADMEYLQNDYAMYPVFAPITWDNYSEATATYSWLYTDPVTHEEKTSANKYDLTLEYLPDYTSEATKKNNLYDPPTLKAEVEGMNPGYYSAPYKKFQAGGKSVMSSPYGELDLSLTQFAPDRQGVTRITVMDDDLGAMSIPVFGYDEFTDRYWLNYSLGGFEAMPGNFSHLIGIANVFFASWDAPLVVNGMNVYGWGMIGDDAELTGTIYAVNSDYSTEYDELTVIARASIKGSDVQTALGDKNSKDYLFLPFHFDQPAVVQASEEHPAFIFMLEGFNSDKVKYFVPFQSKNNSDDDLTSAYMLNQINLSGHVEMGSYYSFKSIRYLEDDEYIFPGGAFAICLDAEYPWLTSEVNTVEMTAVQNEATVALGSYYDGSKLTVEAPEGIVASVSGRYDDCVLTIVRADESGSEVTGDVVVKGPGVEVKIAVKAAPTSGVLSVDASESATYYDLSGRKVELVDAKGIYIVKYNDGKVRKVNVK